MAGRVLTTPDARSCWDGEWVSLSYVALPESLLCDSEGLSPDIPLSLLQAGSGELDLRLIPRRCWESGRRQDRLHPSPVPPSLRSSNCPQACRDLSVTPPLWDSFHRSALLLAFCSRESPWGPRFTLRIKIKIPPVHKISLSCFLTNTPQPRGKEGPHPT